LKIINGNRAGGQFPVKQTVEIGAWFVSKWRQRCSASGVQVVATQMRKQGIPLEVALCVLSGVLA
jgi:hypothetical protein